MNVHILDVLLTIHENSFPQGLFFQFFFEIIFHSYVQISFLNHSSDKTPSVASKPWTVSHCLKNQALIMQYGPETLCNLVYNLSFQTNSGFILPFWGLKRYPFLEMPHAFIRKLSYWFLKIKIILLRYILYAKISPILSVNWWLQ